MVKRDTGIAAGASGIARIRHHRWLRWAVAVLIGLAVFLLSLRVV